MPTVLPGQFQVDENGKQIGHIALTVQWQDGEKLIVTPRTSPKVTSGYPPRRGISAARAQAPGLAKTEACAWRLV